MSGMEYGTPGLPIGQAWLPGRVAPAAQAPSQLWMPHQYGGSEANASPGANTVVTNIFFAEREVTVSRLLVNIATSSGNIDLGIYDDSGADGSPGALIVSSRPLACPSASRAAITIPTTPLKAGRYWAAIAGDNGTYSISYIALVTMRAALVLRYTKTVSYPLLTNLSGMTAESTGNTFVVTPLGV